MKKISFLILSLLTFSLLRAEIQEISQLSEVLDHLPKKSILFCELDEVLIKSPIIASQSAFYEVLKEELIQEGYLPEQVINKAYPIYSDAMKKSSFQITSKEVISFLQTLYQKKISCIPLSHRGPGLAYQTLDQIHLLNLHFPLEESLLKNKIYEPKLAQYYEGCLFIHPICTKSTYLLKWLDQFKLEDKCVVCIDHELIHLVEIEEVLSQKGITFKGFYFKSPEKALTQEQIAIGKLQVKYLNQILPDSIGRVLAKKKNEQDVL